MSNSIRFIGKFFDNHSLSIVNRKTVLELKNIADVQIIPLDAPDISNKLVTEEIDELMVLANKTIEEPDVEIRHSYPPIWKWPESDHTKLVYIQPWEFSAIPMEWQYKFETFADLLITPSNWTRSVFENSGINPKRVKTIPNGYDPKIFFKTKDKKPVTTVKILFVGCSQYRKGLDILLKVWGAATKTTMPLELVIKDTPQVYGASNIQEDIIKLQYHSKCAKITYDDSIKSELEMADLYRACDVIVHPYRGEGFGMHIQEAMICGCVPIVTSGGSTDDFVIDYKIDSSKKVVNLHSIFGLKPEDSTTLMGSHKWVLEPDPNSLAKALNTVINTINSIQVNTSKLSTWSDVAQQYNSAIDYVVNTFEKPKRLSNG
jgi:glycosyltransferase involved in cell wall biosynthesis